MSKERQDLQYKARKQQRRVAVEVQKKIDRLGLTWEITTEVDTLTGLIQVERWASEWLPVMNRQLPAVGELVLVGIASGGPVIFGPPPEVESAPQVAPDDPADATEGVLYRLVPESGPERLVVAVRNAAGDLEYQVLGATAWSATLIDTWGPADYTGDGTWTFDLDALAVDNAGNVLISDASSTGTSNHHVKKYTSAGQFITSMIPDAATGQAVQNVKSIAVDSLGNILIGGDNEATNRFVTKWSSGGTFIDGVGTLNCGMLAGNTEFCQVWGLAIDATNRVYVVDAANVNVKRLSAALAFQDKVNQLFLDLPVAAAIDATGNIWVLDAQEDHLAVFDNTLTHQFNFGGTGSDPGEFINPHGVAIDQSGYMYVSDSGNHRIQVFYSGTLVATIPYTEEQIPYHLAIRSGYLYVVVKDDEGLLPDVIDVWEVPAKGEVGPPGPAGDPGVDGAGVGLGAGYVFSTSTTDADPGPGTLRYNHATPASVTQIFIDNLSAGVDQTALLTAMGAGTSTIKGQLRVHKDGAGMTGDHVFNVTAVTAAAGYHKITVTHVYGSGVLAASDILKVSFSAKGDKGDTGLTGNTGLTGAQGARGYGLPVSIPYLFSTTTTAADPGSGNLRYNHATLASVTEIYADENNSAGDGVSATLAQIGAGTSTVKGVLRVSWSENQELYHLFNVTGLTVESGWRRFSVAYLGGTASGWGNTDPINIAFTRHGDKGDTGTTGATGSPGPGDGMFVNMLMRNRGVAAADITWTDQPSAITEVFGETFGAHRQWVDLTNMTQVRFSIRCAQAGTAGAILFLRYSTDGSTFADLVTSKAEQVSLGAVAEVIGSWQNIVAGAKTTVLLAAFGSGGNGTADPRIDRISAQFK